MWDISGGEIVKWRIERNGRSWQSDEDRVNMLGLMLENVGIDKMLGLFEDLSLLKGAIAEKENKNE
jgi:hypothetical protein